MLSIEEITLEINSLYKDFEELTYLTAGGQKKVFTYKSQNNNYVLKCVPLFVSELEDESYKEEIKENILARSFREIDIMQKVDCSYIVKLGNLVPEIKQIGDNEYLIYNEELIIGEDLQKVLSSRKLTKEEVLKLGLQMATVISILWENKYIHRDIKPNNIMLKENGDFILLDAGIAFDYNANSLTNAGGQPGTKLYMSPEQCSVNGRQIDFRSDLYSLGLVMYEGLCQKHAFIDKTMNMEQAMNALVAREITDISEYREDVPLSLEKMIVKRLLAKRAHKRYKSCESLIRELKNIENEEI